MYFLSEICFNLSEENTGYTGTDVQRCLGRWAVYTHACMTGKKRWFARAGGV